MNGPIGLIDIKQFFNGEKGNNKIKPGEVISYNYGNDSGHSIVYLGDSSDKTGFFFLSYNGGNGDNNIYLGYVKYESFAEIPFNWLKIWSVNQNENKPNTINGSAHCPVEVCISLGDEELNSATGKYTASFGSMLVSGTTGDKTISFTLDYNEDYTISITGTGTGTMDFKIYYGDATDDHFMEFKEVPINNITSINTTNPHANSSFNLFVSKDNNSNIDEVWYARSGETVYEPDDTQIGFFRMTDKPFAIVSDINDDGTINAADLSILLGNFGKTTGQLTHPNADINEDGTVNAADLSILLGSFGKSN